MPVGPRKLARLLIMPSAEEMRLAEMELPPLPTYAPDKDRLPNRAGDIGHCGYPRGYPHVYESD